MNDLTQARKLIKECQEKQNPDLELRSFGITDLKELPELFECKHLESLYLSSNQIFDISVLEKLTGLQQLYLSFNRISDISVLEKLTGLQQLDLSINRISDISVLEKLTGLQQLDLSSNEISDISVLEKLTGLQRLELGSNQISDISVLEKLTGLKQLYVGSNQISDISVLEKLTDLIMLGFRSNQISDIIDLEKLTGLKRLDLRNNKITKIPLSIFQLEMEIYMDADAFWGLCLYGNPIANPPLEIIKEGKEAVFNYLRRIEKEGKEDIYEAKLILVGQGNAGKTSLQIRLRDETADLPTTDKRTRGIEVNDYVFENNKIAHIWDFGGQVIYYPVHRFFITENAVFVLLASTRDENHNFFYWLPTILQFGGQSPIIIGQTCHYGNTLLWNDVGGLFNNPHFNIIKITPKIYFEVDLTNYNRGLYEISECIKEQIKNLPHFGKGVPKSWSTLRALLLEKSISNPCISFETFSSLCDPEFFKTEEDIKDCCRFFHNIGVVLWYSEMEELKDWVILKPEWAMNAVYKIIDDRIIQDNSGLIQKSDFERVWNEKTYIGKHAILKKMLERFKIAFPTRHSQNQTYILPARLSFMPAAKKWELNEELVRLVYKFDFMPKGIVNQLSAELSKNIKGRDVWYAAVNFIYEENESQIIEDSQKQQLSITSKGVEPRSINMLIKYALQNILDEYKGVRPKIYIPCFCGKCQTLEEPTGFFLDDLIEYSKEGEKTVRCNKGRIDLPISQLLYRVGFNYKEIQPPPKDARLSKKRITIFLASSEELKDDREQFKIFIKEENKALNDRGVFLHLIIWEDFIDSMSPTRLQDEIIKAAAEADIFVSLFWTKVGKYTKEEFSSAYNHFKEKGKPAVYTFFKNADIKPKDIREDEIYSLLYFKEELGRLGHFPSNYEDYSNLKYQFKMQLSKLIEADIQHIKPIEQKDFRKNETTRKMKKMFVSYSKEDRAEMNEFIKHTVSLQEQGLIAKPWTDKWIVYGKEWDDEIKRQIEACDIMVCLISVDFLNTEYIRKVELKEAMKQNKILVPIVIKPCDWENCDFAKYQAALKGKCIALNENQKYMIKENTKIERAKFWVEIIMEMRAKFFS